MVGELGDVAAALGHADIATTAIYTTAVGVEARGFLAKMWGSNGKRNEQLGG